MKRPNWLLITLLATCIGFNIVLLFKKTIMSNEIMNCGDALRKCSTSEIKVKTTEHERTILKDRVINTSKLKKVLNSNLFLLNYEVYIVLFFKSNDCSNCILQEVDKLNEMFNDKTAGIFGFYSSDNKNPLDEIKNNYKIIFHLEIIDSIGSIIKIEKTPSILVISRSKYDILDVYTAEPNNLFKRDVFYEKWKRIIHTF